MAVAQIHIKTTQKVKTLLTRIARNNGISPRVMMESIWKCWLNRQIISTPKILEEPRLIDDDEEIFAPIKEYEPEEIKSSS